MSEQDYLIELTTIALADLLIQDKTAASISDALDIIYNSDTYEKLSNPSTHLMYEHPGYVYQILQSELRNGKLTPP